MAAKILKPAILVVSDTASENPSTDKAGNALSETFASEGQDLWAPPTVAIVPDSVLEIQKTVQEWADGENYMNLVITTGGTGFAVKDYTPEAIIPLLHKHAPGLIHAMLSASLQVTPFASMSRPVAGVRNKTLILTLPGSPKGAKENLQAVLKLLPHACVQASGADSRSLHAGGVEKLERDAGVTSNSKPSTASSPNPDHHHHHHGHSHGGHKVPKAHPNLPNNLRSNDPSLGPFHRARESPFEMLPVSSALSEIAKITPVPIPETLPHSPSLVGCVISADVHASEAVPAYRASIVDGYAIIIDTSSKSDQAKSKPGVYPVASVSHAQAASYPPPLQPGEIARITTGAPLPPNANAVVMSENTVTAAATAGGTEEATVEVLTDAVEIGENIRELGSDVPKGSLILKKGSRISSTGGEIGVLAAAGIHNVPVYRRSRVGVLSTGDELVDISIEKTLTGGEIRDSNRPALLSVIRAWGLCDEVVDLGIARDTPEGELEDALRGGFRRHGLDVIVTSGGVSMGELDLLKPTIERKLGGTIHFGRVSMKPGKPTTFASVPFKDAGSGDRIQKLIFGLPGNPASAIVTAHLFLLPALQKMAGLEGGGLERVQARLAERVKRDPVRTEYHRVTVGVGEDGVLVTKSTGAQRSSRVASLAGAGGLLILEPKEGWVEAGTMADVLLTGGIVGL